MSRSRKKTPICGNTKAESEKGFKRLWHRAFRLAERMALGKVIPSDDDFVPMLEREVSHIWSGEKDGKHYFGDSERMTEEDKEKEMRK